MIDRTKLIKEVNELSESLFVDVSSEHAIARKVWQQICNDPTLAYTVRTAQTTYPVPFWDGVLNNAIQVKPLHNYSVISVDGSQIYPDKHEGTPCYLVNIGEVIIRYGQPKKPVTLNSEPHLFTGRNRELFESTIDGVNCKRQELELTAGLKKSILEQKYGAKNIILLFDGSLIFWHLEAKEQELRCYIDVYLDLLDQMYHACIPFASYMSLPKSRELSNVLRLALAGFKAENEEKAQVIDHIIDTTVAHFYLTPNTRSIVFKNNNSIVKEYPPHLVPYFFYIHVGTEIGRVEIPAWIAQKHEYVDLIASVVLDQAIKGNGYPIVIAEAHEQAVVKGTDREFFYQLIAKAAVEQKRSILKSKKSSRKRRIGI